MLNVVKLTLVVLIAASLAFGQARKIATSSAKATPAKATPAKMTSAKATPVRSTTVTKTTYKAPATKAARVTPTRFRKAVYRAPIRTTYVMTPTPERYREIQQALADKGYYTAEVNGSWDAASIDALNRFKTAQNLKADGKLCSLSLIALGLGPKYETVTADQLAPATPIPADRQ
jgi:peptidoglycan hydrolase-like protein with peptidoglycan-binding domain